MNFYIVNNPFEYMAPYFHTFGLNDRVLSYLWSLLFFLMILTLLSLFYYFLIKKNNQKKNDISVITDKKVIKKILEDVLTYRTRIDIILEGSNKNYIYATLIKFDYDFLWIEVPYYIKVNYMWLNKNIICFFKVSKIDDLNSIYYHFKTRIIDFEKNEQNIYVLKVDFPAQLSLGQKRRFLRVKLSPKYVQKLQIWTARSDPGGGFSQDMTQWEKPWAEYSNQEGKTEIWLEDISGGGVRLGIKKEVFPRFKKLTDKNYMFLGLKFDPELVPPKLTQLFFLAKLKKIYWTDQEDCFFLGLEFVAQGKVIDQDKVRWVMLEENKGCEELVDWLFEQYVQLYREKLKEKE